MKKASLALALVLALSLPAWAQKHPEDWLVAQLDSPDGSKVVDAMKELEKQYPESPRAIAKMTELLKDRRDEVKQKAARVLGALHVKLADNTIADVIALLSSPNRGVVINGLKAIRDLNAPAAVPAILPLLQGKDSNVKRDALPDPGGHRGRVRRPEARATSLGP